MEMNMKNTLLLILCSLFFSVSALAQNQKMTGKVVDEKGLMIQGDKIGTLEMMEYDYLQQQKEWGKIIKKAAKEEPKSRACQNVVSLARFYQKQISPDAFSDEGGSLSNYLAVSNLFRTFARRVRPEVAKAIILPSVEVSKSAVPSAVA